MPRACPPDAGDVIPASLMGHCTTDHCRFVLEKSDPALELTELTEHQFE